MIWYLNSSSFFVLTVTCDEADSIKNEKKDVRTNKLKLQSELKENAFIPILHSAPGKHKSTIQDG